MSYIRFENTLMDLDDCLSHINDRDLSPSEQESRKALIEVCKEIIEDADEDIEYESD